MNPFNRFFCRVYQKAFWMAIPVLPYRTPRILNSTHQLPQELTNNGVDNILIVTDKVLNDLGKLEPLKEQLDIGNIRYTVYDKTVPNPTVANVEEALKLYKAKGCNGLIGFGGGSAIDCAKAVGARIAKPKKSINQMRGILRVRKKIPLLVAIPTTSGTGSEVTVTTVITDTETGNKAPLSDFPLIPRIAVLDAENTKTMPLSVTATTGMDALVHAIEAYIGGSTTSSSQKDALTAAKLVICNLETAYKYGNNEIARANMMKAAFLAGRAFSKSYVGYCHAVAHSLGGKYNIPHGLANAVLIPIVLDAYGKSAHKKLYKLAVYTGVAEKSDSYALAAEKFIAKIRKMNQNMNIPEKLSGIKKEDIPSLAKHAAKEANPLYPVPKLMNAKELEQFYIKAADWS